MIFLIVLRRTLKRWFFFWDIHRIPSKWVKLRFTIGLTALLLVFTTIPIFYFKGYLPYQDFVYPPLSKMNVDSGVWVFSHSRKLDYLLTQDNKKILFRRHGQHLLYEYRDNIMKSQGLNVLSKFDPEIHVKAWWFSAPHAVGNLMGQLEIEGKIHLSYKDSYKSFLIKKNPSGLIAFEKFFFTIFLVLFLWELLSQYITYRQENN